MKRFTVPADFKIETIEKYIQFNETAKGACVFETYGQMTNGGITASGRINASLPQIGLNELEKYVAFSKKHNIEFNYTINPSCMGNLEHSIEGQSKILELVNQLWNMGVTTFTVAIPGVMELIRYSKPQSRIVASTICEVNSLSKAHFYKQLGVGRIVVDTDINRNLPLIQAMTNSCGNILEIIVNNLCIYNCAYKMFHYNHDSHCTGSMKGSTFFTSRCITQKHRQMENILKCNWIRPEDINKYESCGIEYFKLQGRPNVLHGQPWKSVYAYSNGYYYGNLCDVLTLFSPSINGTYIDNQALDGFLDNFCACRTDKYYSCDDCTYCKQYALKSVRDSDFSNSLISLLNGQNVYGALK